MQADRGFAFVKLDTHENAASAIVNLAGQIACGRPIKCGWGKDRNESAMLGVLRQGMHLSGYGNIVSVNKDSMFYRMTLAYVWA
jgi:RNA recognition motif-containing protein